LFSGILSAFLIEVRKGLQILRELEGSRNSAGPFKPTATSVSVNWLWLLSLCSSLMGALGVMVAKSFGRRWVRDTELLNLLRREGGHALTHLENYELPWLAGTRDKAWKRRRMHVQFGRAFMALITLVASLIYLALVLFFVGLILLLHNDEGELGTGISVFLGAFGAIFILFYLYNVTPWDLRCFRTPPTYDLHMA
jgi:hypothetical protein